MDLLLQDVRYAVRRLTLSPLFATGSPSIMRSRYHT